MTKSIAEILSEAREIEKKSLTWERVHIEAFYAQAINSHAQLLDALEVAERKLRAIMAPDEHKTISSCVIKAEHALSSIEQILNGVNK